MTDVSPTPQPVQPAPVMADTPTLESLAAENAALRKRVARLEAFCHIVIPETIIDMDQPAALSLTGGDTTQLASVRENVSLAPVIQEPPNG